MTYHLKFTVSVLAHSFTDEQEKTQKHLLLPTPVDHLSANMFFPALSSPDSQGR